MPVVNIHNLGVGGIVRDTPAHLLPPELWSNGRNVRFADNKVVKFVGESQVFNPPSIVPYWAINVEGAAEKFWVYAGLNKVYSFASTVHTDITRASGGDYSATADDLWNGEQLGGILVLNNGVDIPQSWTGVTGATKLEDLVNWPATLRAKNVKPYLNFLVALNVTKSGVASRHMVKWSHSADPGTLPDSWDEADPTKDTGEQELSDTQAGPIVDQLVLKRTNIIYKEQSSWLMQPISSSNIFVFNKFLETSGLLTEGAATTVGSRTAGRSNQHFVATGDDIIVHNGQNAQSVIDKRLRKWLNSIMSTTRFNRAFSVRNDLNKECWFCFPEEGEDWPSLALAWNWIDNTLTIRELKEASVITPGVIPITNDETWDSDTGTWDSDATVWDQLTGRPQETRLLQVDPVGNQFLYLDDTDQFAGVNMTAFLERLGLAVVGQDRQGQPKVDLQSRKLVTRIWPKARGGPFNVQLGSQQYIDGPVTYAAAQSFDPATNRYLDFCVEGPLLAVRFESTGNVAWEVDGYDLDVEITGQF